MTNVLHAIILGIVQGLTELLPISSSAHLYAIPKLLGWGEIGDFDVALHAGTLLAIAIFFFKDWLKLIVGGYKKVVKKENSFEGKMFWYIVAATIPGGIIGFVLDKFCEDILTNPLIIGLALIIMGIVLYIVDKKAKNEVEYENMTFKQTFLIGLSQALAFIPGVSRSGITMTTGRMMGIKREAVARYSFMLSAPIVLAATIYKLKDFVFNPAFFAGVFVSFIVGLLVIKFLLNYLKKGDFKWFAIYRIIFGVIIILCLAL
ncbi:MAG: undecaprenyl-diphosphatase UppP [Clostridia bacterium]|nr:undecaprenyl-diphosphatase UppP [Clostridia bacterium]